MYNVCMYRHIYCTVYKDLYIHLDPHPPDPHADPVMTGIIFNCVALLILITLMTMTYHFIRKHDQCSQKRCTLDVGS